MIYASMPSPWRHLPQSRRPVPFDINPRQPRLHLFLTLFRMRRYWGGAWPRVDTDVPLLGGIRLSFFPDYDAKTL